MTYQFEFSRCHLHPGTYGTQLVLGRGDTEAEALRDAFERLRVEPYHPDSVVHSVTLDETTTWPWLVCADVAGRENIGIGASRGKQLPDQSRPATS